MMVVGIGLYVVMMLVVEACRGGKVLLMMLHW